MKTIINKYHKKLVFPLVGIAIDTNETKSVTNEQATQLLANKWIILHTSAASERNAKKVDAAKYKIKGRK